MHGRLDELVALAAGVGLAIAAIAVGAPAGPRPWTIASYARCVRSQRRSRSMAVVAAADGRDARRVGLVEAASKLGQEAVGRARRRVAAVE
jgi:hypothetical protein